MDEVGNRKQIVSLVTGSLLKQVIIAIVIALPVASLGISKWLGNFAYRMELGWWMFVLTSLVAMVIAFVTVSLQAVKAAVGNPVESLRSELGGFAKLNNALSGLLSYVFPAKIISSYASVGLIRILKN